MVPTDGTPAAAVQLPHASIVDKQPPRSYRLPPPPQAVGTCVVSCSVLALPASWLSRTRCFLYPFFPLFSCIFWVPINAVRGLSLCFSYLYTNPSVLRVRLACIGAHRLCSKSQSKTQQSNFSTPRSISKSVRSSIKPNSTHHVYPNPYQRCCP